MRFFADNSPFNSPLPPDAPLDPNSTGIVAALVAACEAKAYINTTSWSVPVYLVPANQPTVKVTGVQGAGRNTMLASAWSAVPLPPEAKPAGGTDRHLVVWQPSTDKLWEFWGLSPGPVTVPVEQRNPKTGRWELMPQLVNGKYVLPEETIEGWSARWGGAITGVSMHPGAYGSAAGESSNWGASACSISIAVGLITLDDLDAGKIDHALAMACPLTRAGVWCPPAKRTDGGSQLPSSIPEGAQLRLDPTVDLESLEMPPLTRMMARAAQTYGIFIRDSSGACPFYAEDPTRLGAAANPYLKSTGPGTPWFGGKSPKELLASFPWQHLQLLEMVTKP